MSDFDNKIIVDKKEYTDLIQDKHYLMGRITELEKQINVLQGMLIEMLKQNADRLSQEAEKLNQK